MWLRSLVGACAACAATIVTNAIDRRAVCARAQREYHSHTQDLFVGILHTFVISFVFFAVYDALNPLGPHTAVYAAGASCIVGAPFNVVRRHRQLRQEFKLTIFATARCACADVGRVCTRAAVKYAMYEPMMVEMTTHLPKSVAGAVSGCLSSLIMGLLLAPFDAVSTQLAACAPLRVTYDGALYAIACSVLNSAITHGLHELFRF